VEKDLIEASHQDQGLALGIEPFQDSAGASPAAWTQRPIVDRAGAAFSPNTTINKAAT
jgi:hypothetical protein